MDNKDNPPTGMAETAALSALAVLTGAVLTWVICGLLVNILEYHSLSSPLTRDDGANLGEGFLLPLVVVFALFLFPVLTILLLRIFSPPKTLPAGALTQDVSSLPWILLNDFGDGFGVYQYKGHKLVFSKKGVKWKTSTFDSPTQAISSIDSYDG